MYYFQAAFFGLLTGLGVGLIRMGLDFAAPIPACGSGEPDTRFNVTAKVDFLHFAIINTIVCTVVMVTISLFTKPRPPEKVNLAYFFVVVLL